MNDRASEIVIYTVEGSPGVGKTTKQMQEISDLITHKKKVFITSRTHSWCDEWEDYLKDQDMPVRHWEGWTRKCPLYNHNSIIDKLKAKNIPTANICAICHEKNLYPKQQCLYHLQFENLPQVVISPIEYVHTKYLSKKFKPDIILIDDCLKSFSALNTIEKIDEFLRHLQRWGNLAGIDEALKDYVNVTSLKRVFELDEDDFETFMKRVKEVHKRNMTAAAKSLAEIDDELMLFLTIRPEEIAAYYKCRELPDIDELKAVGVPALFPVFDYIAKSDAELRIIDAIINKDLLDLWKKRYRKETGIEVLFVPKNVDREFEDCGSVVYRIKAHTFFPPGTIKKDPVKWKQRIRAHENWVLETRHPNIIAKETGIVQPQDFETEIPIFEDGVVMDVIRISQFVPNRFWTESDKVGSLHYGDLRGKNDLEDKIVGFVVCTYLTNHYNNETGEGIISDFKMMFAVDPFKGLEINLDKFREKEVKEKVYENADPHHGHYHFKHKGLDAWRWLHEEYEQYQAIHRFRPLNHKCSVYVYGKVPREICDELTVKSLSFKIGGDKVDEKTKWLIEYVKDHEGCVPKKMVKYDLGKEFKIGDEWARVIVNRIVANVDELEFAERNGLRCIIHE